MTRRGRPTLTSSEPSAASREVAEGLLSRRPTDEIRAFYDQLAPDYTALFRDWDASVVRQGEILERLIAAGLPGYVAPATTRVLDATCGIGTQAIGLALRGYAVTGSDVSAASVDRARSEAARLGARPELLTADVRALPDRFERSFDVAIAFDNALPHLVDPEDLRGAFDQLRRALRRGGLLLVSVRDYDRILADRPAGEAARISGVPGSRRAVAQAWEWQDDAPVYRLHQFVLQEAIAGWSVRHLETRYRAYRRIELAASARAAGFERTEWLEPADTGFYQPVLRGLGP